MREIFLSIMEMTREHIMRRVENNERKFLSIILKLLSY